MVDHVSTGLQKLLYCKSELHLTKPSRRVEHDSPQVVRERDLCLGEFFRLELNLGRARA
jgi:hypothetical protein